MRMLQNSATRGERGDPLGPKSIIGEEEGRPIYLSWPRRNVSSLPAANDLEANLHASARNFAITRSVSALHSRPRRETYRAAPREARDRVPAASISISAKCRADLATNSAMSRML